MKEWTIEVYILDEAGNEKPAKCFTKVVYNLHPSFDNPVQSTSFLPFSRAWSVVGLIRDAQPSTSRRSNAPTRAGANSK